MSVPQSYFLAACFLFIVYLICKAMHDRGRSISSPQLKARMTPTGQSNQRVEVANQGQRGIGWVEPGGAGVLGNHLLIQALRDAGWRGNFWK